MPRWTKQTYEMVAEVLADTRETARKGRGMALYSDVELSLATDFFARRFAEDSPNFDESRFRYAAGEMLSDPRARRRPAKVRVRGHRREVR